MLSDMRRRAAPFLLLCVSLLACRAGGAAGPEGGAAASPAATTAAAPAESERDREAEQARRLLEERVLALAERVAVLEERLGRVERTQAEAPKGTEAGGAATARRPRGPDPAEIYAIPVANHPSDGKPNAPVTLVRSFEFDCPFCHRSLPTMEELRKIYGRDLRIVYRMFIVHPRSATDPALAACAAHRQGKFRAMHDLIWTKGYEANRNLAAENMEKLAREVGLDMERYRSDVSGPCKQAVQDGHAELVRLGQTGTPSFWINGRFMSGARPIDAFKAIIDEELALAKTRIGKEGTTRSNYYERWVLAKGKSAP